MKSAWDFRDLKGDGIWRNPCEPELNINIPGLKSRLHPSESIMGNYNGKVLVVGQDWFGWERIIKKGGAPWEQDLTLPTNKVVTNVFKPSDGVMINALWFLRPQTTGTLPKMSSDARDANRDILEYTIRQMSNVERIVCLGQKSYRFLHYTMFGKLGSVPTKRLRDSFKIKGVDAVYFPHVGNFGINNMRKAHNFPSYQDTKDYIIKYAKGETDLYPDEYVKKLSENRVSILTGFNPFYIK